MLKLADKGHLRISGRKVVADLGLDVPGAEQIPFASLGSRHFGKELFGNMIALGRILRIEEPEGPRAMPVGNVARAAGRVGRGPGVGGGDGDLDAGRTVRAGCRRAGISR